jgi:predicted RNase H-like HicB family nuclease
VGGQTLDELRQEVRDATELLLEIALDGSAPPAQPDFRFRDAAIVAA